jgi:hypothetical protein
MRFSLRIVWSRSSANSLPTASTALKQLRKGKRVPVYAVFTNNHLADLVHQQVTSLEGLKGISGYVSNGFPSLG